MPPTAHERRLTALLCTTTQRGGRRAGHEKHHLLRIYKDSHSSFNSIVACLDHPASSAVLSPLISRTVEKHGLFFLFIVHSCLVPSRSMRRSTSRASLAASPSDCRGCISTHCSSDTSTSTATPCATSTSLSHDHHVGGQEISLQALSGGLPGMGPHSQNMADKHTMQHSRAPWLFM